MRHRPIRLAPGQVWRATDGAERSLLGMLLPKRGPEAVRYSDSRRTAIVTVHSMKVWIYRNTAVLVPAGGES